MTITGRRGRFARISSSNSRPLRPCMRMSVTSTSGTPWRSAASAASACSNARVSRPACLSARSSTQRMEASSSTIQTSSALAEFMVVEWQEDGEDGAPRTAVELDQPVVAADEVLRDGEAEAGAALAARDERIEHGVLDFAGHPGAVVLDLDARDDAIAPAADARVRERPRAQHDAPAGAHRLDRVADEVEPRLDDLVAVESQARPARIVVAFDHDARRSLGGEQVTDVLHEF